MLNKFIAVTFFILTLLLLPACSVTQQGADSATSEHSKTYLQAISAMKEGKLKQARTLLQKVLKKQPNFSNAHVNIGIVFAKIRSLNEAENSFLYSLKIEPENFYALNQLGILYRNQGKFSAAKKVYEKAIDINSDYAFAHLNLGILYDLYLYDLPKAIEQYKKYLSIMDGKDKKVEKWIIDLERQYKKSLALK